MRREECRDKNYGVAGIESVTWLGELVHLLS